MTRKPFPFSFRHFFVPFIFLSLGLPPRLPAAEGGTDSLQALVRACASASQVRYSKDGDWETVGAAGHSALYKKLLGHGPENLDPSQVKRLLPDDKEHLPVNYNSLGAEGLHRLETEGIASLGKLYYTTSGAGLWTRGGGLVKALVPFNVAEVLGEKDFQKVKTLNGILLASSPEEVLQKAGVELKQGENLSEVKDHILRERKEELDGMIAKAREQSGALTPLDVKFVNVALASELAGKDAAGKPVYIPFDIQTSQQTHQQISQYVNWFRTHFQDKIFDPNPAVDEKIKSALRAYFEKSEALGDTHVFGYQIGYRGIDPVTGGVVQNTSVIGVGAGTFKENLERSGRLKQLRDRGKTLMIFDNIEVVTDLPLTLGAHQRSGKPISVVLVPEGPTYKGGTPYLVKTGKKDENGQDIYALRLIEQSSLPKDSDLLRGNYFFNSNTFVIPTDANVVYPDSLGSEKKVEKGHSIIRAKLNVGDITFGYPTAGIVGRQGDEYENLKSLDEYQKNGMVPIRQVRAQWESQAARLP